MVTSRETFPPPPRRVRVRSSGQRCRSLGNILCCSRGRAEKMGGLRTCSNQDLYICPQERPCAAKGATTRRDPSGTPSNPPPATRVRSRLSLRRARRDTGLGVASRRSTSKGSRLSETELYRKVLRKRQAEVKSLFAEATDWHTSRKFRLRTLEKVNVKALLIAAGQNIKKLSPRSKRPEAPNASGHSAIGRLPAHTSSVTLGSIARVALGV
jgi:hypothetical protein